jgi:hypothetical protein
MVQEEGEPTGGPRHVEAPTASSFLLGRLGAFFALQMLLTKVPISERLVGRLADIEARGLEPA